MAPKRPAAAASSLASDGEADVSPHPDSRPHSPSPSRSRSRSKTPPPNLHPSSAALSSTPASGAADFAAASDSDTGEDGRRPSPSRSRESSPRLHSDSDNSAAIEVPVAAASDEEGGAASQPPHARRSSLVEAANTRPLSSCPMDRSRRTAAGSSASQRRSKRPRTSPAVHSPEHHRRQRFWSPEDEIVILRALISYRAKKGVLPANNQDTGKLHSQIRGQINAEASTTQLSDKVRRLKHKYNLLASRTKSGRNPDLPTVHDRDVYELSRKVWGSKNGGVGSAGGGGRRVHENVEFAENGELQESGESDDDMKGWWDDPDDSRNRMSKAVANGNGSAIAIQGCTGHGNIGGKGDVEKGKDMYPYLWEAVEELSKEHPSRTMFTKAFGVLEGSRAQAMEEKLQNLRLSEIRQQLHRMDLMKETVKMVLDALEGTA